MLTGPASRPNERGWEINNALRQRSRKFEDPEYTSGQGGSYVLLVRLSVIRWIYILLLSLRPLIYVINADHRQRDTCPCTWWTVDVTEWGDWGVCNLVAERDRSGGYWCSCGMFTVTLCWLILVSFRGTPPGDVDDLGMMMVGSAAHLRFTLSCNACFHFYPPLLGLVLSEDWPWGTEHQHLWAFLFIIILESNS